MPPAARKPHGSPGELGRAQPHFIKVFPHEYKRVLGVARAERPLHSAPRIAASRGRGRASRQVQHG